MGMDHLTSTYIALNSLSIGSLFIAFVGHCFRATRLKLWRTSSPNFFLLLASYLTGISSSYSHYFLTCTDMFAYIFLIAGPAYCLKPMIGVGVISSLASGFLTNSFGMYLLFMS